MASTSAFRNARPFLNESIIRQLETKVVAGDLHAYEALQAAAREILEQHTAQAEPSRAADGLFLEAIRVRTPPTFTEAMRRLHENVGTSGEAKPIVSTAFFDAVRQHSETYDAWVRALEDHDESLDAFALMTLERSYLLRDFAGIVERPVYMYMRVALALSLDQEVPVDKIYALFVTLATRRASFATPVLFNAGCAKNPNLSSCFLYALTSKEDNIDGIFSALHDCANISHMSGGLGISLHDIRCRGSPINGGTGTAQGVLPIMQLFNTMAKSVDQGGGKRRGSIAAYLEVHHPDLFEFLEARMTYGNSEARTHDLFLAVWVSDLFMQRVEADGLWSFFCPELCPGLSECWGEAYERLYRQYEDDGKASKQLPARQVFWKIIDVQLNASQPYLLFKDHCNRKSNQKNLGTIRSSNLCSEVVLYSDSTETAVCNLASVCLPKFARPGKHWEHGGYDFDNLWETTYRMACFLDLVVTQTHYPIEKARKSNLRHRPLGLGTQGLADCFCAFNLPWGSAQAKELDEALHACVYHAAITASSDLAVDHGASYETFAGSPASQGLLQFDLWEKEPYDLAGLGIQKFRGWSDLRHRAKQGLRNSVSIALMPTASTAHIAGNSECIEPYTAMLFTRNTLSGEFVVVNKFLREILRAKDAWTSEIIDSIIKQQGSIQHLDVLDAHEKNVFKTAWEIRQKDIVEHSASRGKYVCQSTSLNIHMANPSRAKLSALHFASWKLGNKTSSYYIRMQSTASAIQFALQSGDADRKAVITSDSHHECLMCSA